MAEGSSRTGYLSQEELQNSPGIPSEARRRKGAVAVIECVERIPCNPCEASCRAGAITVGEDLTNLPHLDEDKCVACQSCVPICPGQAIFMVDESLGDGKAAVTLPYEFLPLPQEGEVVTALDRSGVELGPATVTAIRKTERMDQTAVVTLEVPAAWSMRARGLRLKR